MPIMTSMQKEVILPDMTVYAIDQEDRVIAIYNTLDFEDDGLSF